MIEIWTRIHSKEIHGMDSQSCFFKYFPPRGIFHYFAQFHTAARIRPAFIIISLLKQDLRVFVKNDTCASQLKFFTHKSISL